MTESCHICSLPKGQPPERCNGHYQTALRPAPDNCGTWLSDSYATRVDDFSWIIPDLGGEEW